jgi:hypothetical protein
LSTGTDVGHGNTPLGVQSKVVFRPAVFVRAGNRLGPSMKNNRFFELGYAAFEENPKKLQT